MPTAGLEPATPSLEGLYAIRLRHEGGAYFHNSLLVH